MTNSSDKIKAKIAALLAKAESTSFPEEADSYMAKVNELLEEHQIEEYEIRQRMDSQVDSDPVGHEAGQTNLYASIKWARDIAGALSNYYGCKWTFRRVGNHFKYTIIGRESARTTYELMLPFIISQVKVQAKRLWLRYPHHNTLSVWEREVGQALYSRIWNLVYAARAHREELVANALVPVDTTQDYYDKLYPKGVKEGRSVKLSYTREAKEAAERVSLHHQATGRGKTKLLEG